MGISRVATLNEREILQTNDFLKDLGEIADRQQITSQVAQKQAEEILQELAVRPQDRYLNWVAKLARFMTSRSYDSELDVNAGQIKHLKALSQQQPLIFLWSHKSHLDSFVFMRAMYDNDFIPQPLSFAGINMNFAGFGALAKRSGAIFVRRSFSKDEIYKLVFRYYIDYLVGQRLPLSWSIEGTRSRTGKLMPPKLGLLNWVIDAHRRSASDNVLLVPVSISFDQIAEIDDYVAMQRGQSKRKESLKWFIDYIRGMNRSYGKICVRFAEPIALSDSVNVSESMFDESSAPDRIQTQKLAFEVCSRIEHATPVRVSDIVTLALLAANDRALVVKEIRSQVFEVAALVRQQNLPTTVSFNIEDSTDLSVALNMALDVLTQSGLVRCFDKAGTAVYSIAPGQKLAAAYYRNTISHYFLTSALSEIALAALSDKAVENPQDDVLQKVMDLRDLLKFEFFYKPRDEFRRDIVDYLGNRFPGWQSALDERRSPFAEKPPLFGQGILRSFIEAYFVLSRTLLAMGVETPSDEKDLVNRCLALGDEMLLRGKIDCASALSKPLFENAVRLAVYRDLVSSDTEGVENRRNQFAIEMDQMLAAINSLQIHYDKHLVEIACDN